MGPSRCTSAQPWRGTGLRGARADLLASLAAVANASDTATASFEVKPSATRTRHPGTSSALRAQIRVRRQARGVLLLRRTPAECPAQLSRLGEPPGASAYADRAPVGSGSRDHDGSVAACRRAGAAPKRSPTAKTAKKGARRQDARPPTDSRSSPTSRGRGSPRRAASRTRASARRRPSFENDAQAKEELTRAGLH